MPYDLKRRLPGGGAGEGQWNSEDQYSALYGSDAVLKNKRDLDECLVSSSNWSPWHSRKGGRHSLLLAISKGRDSETA